MFIMHAYTISNIYIIFNLGPSVFLQIDYFVLSEEKLYTIGSVNN